ncbi:TraR/DksA family transcriptional regulator [Comamonas jiangduensis]|uniref:TraR/DksA family transcriptional regulator n=1 Tax=Comamonas jiangduensis TaxID=1194168 RepID=UPI003BF7E868
MSTITKTHLQALKTHLQQRAQQLQQELDTARSEQAQSVLDTEDLPPEPDANQSRDTSDREVRHAEQMRDQQELKDVRAALQRMEDGSYGECMDCGKGIALARLQAFPSAKRCIACQTLHEDKKRRA